jgi:hypothetical protein
MVSSRARFGVVVIGAFFLSGALWNASRPVHALGVTATPVAPYAACPGAPKSQLAVGSWSVANPALKTSLNLRAQPARAAASLGLMARRYPARRCVSTLPRPTDWWW